MKKRHLIYAFLAGVLLTGAVCIRIMSKVELYIENAKVVQMRDEYVTINFYHSNTDRHYYVRVPIVEMAPGRNIGGGIYVATVTTKLWSTDDAHTTDTMFRESALEAADELIFQKPEWSIPDKELRK